MQVVWICHYATHETPAFHANRPVSRFDFHSRRFPHGNARFFEPFPTRFLIAWSFCRRTTLSISDWNQLPNATNTIQRDATRTETTSNPLQSTNCLIVKLFASVWTDTLSTRNRIIIRKSNLKVSWSIKLEIDVITFLGRVNNVTVPIVVSILRILTVFNV